jgi:hypothetical protein
MHRPRRGHNSRIVLRLIALLAVLSMPGTVVYAQQSGPRRVTSMATLSILAGIVQHVPAGGGQPQAAQDGMNLALGDRILTGPKSLALVTFLDGSTLTVHPDADIAVQHAAFSATQSTVRVKLNLGTVWARVVRLADPQSHFSLESNTATATVHDGLIGAEQANDNVFRCWTRAGTLTVSDAQGHVLGELAPGEKTRVTLDPSSRLVPEPFSVNLSRIRVTSSRGVLPVLIMDDGVRLAGFVAPHIEVNQVFGSLTRASGNETFLVEVPAGAPGPYTLVVQGVRTGPFKVQLVGTFQDRVESGQSYQVYAQELTGTITKGGRRQTRITQRLDPATAHERQTARVEGGHATPFAPFRGPLPGKLVLSPQEIQSVNRP